MRAVSSRPSGSRRAWHAPQLGHQTFFRGRIHLPHLLQLVQHALDVRRLVEREARLEFPADIEPLVAGIADAPVPGGDQPAQQIAVVGLAMQGRRLHRVDPDALDAEVDREVAVGLEACDVLGRVARIQQMLAPQILREAGEGKTGVVAILKEEAKLTGADPDQVASTAREAGRKVTEAAEGLGSLVKWTVVGIGLYGGIKLLGGLRG